MTVHDKLTQVPVTVAFIRDYPGGNGRGASWTVTLLVMRDYQGRKLVWRASRKLEVAPGSRWLLSGQIKAIVARGEGTEHHLTRCRLEIHEEVAA